jgi:hypothetical protein
MRRNIVHEIVETAGFVPSVRIWSNMPFPSRLVGDELGKCLFQIHAELCTNVVNE